MEKLLILSNLKASLPATGRKKSLSPNKIQTLKKLLIAPIIINVDEVSPFSTVASSSEVSSASNPGCSNNDNVLTSTNDIHFCLHTTLTDMQKLSIIEKIWSPGESHVFPASTPRNLRFQNSWLKRFKWLAYSQVEDGAFCKYCVLFGNKSGMGRGRQTLGTLCAKKFDNWKKALDRFKEHELSNYHGESVMIAEGLKSVMENRQESVYNQLIKAAKQQTINNQKRVLPIIEAVIFRGRQGVPLRGHVDAGPYTIEEPTTNEGNFRALVMFRIKDNKEWQELFVNAPKHAQYLSPQIQNEIISICNDLILSNLVKKITQAEYFSVLADETTDISCKEQLSICIRYVDSDNCLQEDFLQFIEVDGLSGESLSRAILTNLQRFGIDISKMRGQGYDGGAAMSGRLHGVQAYVREVVPTAVYVHCAAHSLNLVISRLCSIQAVRNCIGIIGAVCKFFNTPK